MHCLLLGSGWIANLLLYGLRPCYATRTLTNYTPPAVDGAFQDPAPYFYLKTLLEE